MQARRIPRNPNSPPPAAPAGIQAHWSRTLVLMLLLVVIGYALRAQLTQPNRSVPAPALPLPTSPLQPALSRAQPQLAPTIGPARLVPTIGAEASAVPSGAHLRDLLQQVNNAFTLAHATADIAPLRAVATGSWLEYEQAQIDILRQSGQTQRWRLLYLDPQPAAIQDDHIVVTTRERWEVTVQPNSSASPAVPSCYIEHYRLVRQGSAWLVSQIDFEEKDCAE